MINCPRCKRVTSPKEPTKLLFESAQWTDVKGRVHNDITGQTRVCGRC